MHSAPAPRGFLCPHPTVCRVGEHPGLCHLLGSRWGSGSPEQVACPCASPPQVPFCSLSSHVKGCPAPNTDRILRSASGSSPPSLQPAGTSRLSSSQSRVRRAEGGRGGQRGAGCLLRGTCKRDRALRSLVHPRERRSPQKAGCVLPSLPPTPSPALPASPPTLPAP